MKRSMFLVAGLSLAASAFTLLAQDNGPGPRHASGTGGPRQGAPPGRPHLLLALDANRDGALAPDELATAPAHLLQLDQNGDGQITQNESCPRGRRPAGPECPPECPRRADASATGEDGSSPARVAGPLPPVLRALDTDQDGVLSAAEIANAPQALMALDTNLDGVLSWEELRPQHRGPGLRGGGRFGPPEHAPGPGLGGGARRGPRFAQPEQTPEAAE